MDAINLEVTQHAQSQKSDTVPKIKSKRKWNENVKRYEDLWATNQKELFETCIASQAVDISFCCQCEKQIFTVIRCQTCNGQYFTRIRRAAETQATCVQSRKSRFLQGEKSG